MTGVWVVVTAVALYLQKLLGLSVPPSLLERDRIRRVLTLLPIALLGALTVVQSADSAGGPVVDARLVGLGAAAAALALRAPFLAVVVIAAVTTAGLRLLV